MRNNRSFEAHPVAVDNGRPICGPNQPSMFSNSSFGFLLREDSRSTPGQPTHPQTASPSTQVTAAGVAHRLGCRQPVQPPFVGR